MKRIFTIISLLTFCGSLNAQELKFDKKSGDFTSTSGVVAKLNSERVKAPGKFSLGVGKNYMVTDASGANESIRFMLHRFDDTLGSPVTTWYYSVHSSPLGLTAYTPNMPGNMFKEVGEMVVSKNLLQADGKINEPAMKAYFTSLQNDNGDYEKRFKEMNDSEMQMVNIPAPIVERNTNRDVTANEYGKIGQGNVVIGMWEYIEAPKGDAFGGVTHHFRIKNLNGGIICISWIELSGAHTYIFKDGVRSADNWTLPDLINNNPITYKERYVVELSKHLIGKGLL